ncbi:Prolyl 3-hydroxylase OGFOD1 [Astathelohania contejeani]|uniref:Prolyl 3-hydroxylase OGFOD1 n=1 Tax=Astathelohania contejeani TaxID=164912 RepID=A0ABQ7HX20_9MICR|nr:Prolyl 3-hydroxylase OGFOD1 [Thelohania contejeani]
MEKFTTPFNHIVLSNYFSLADYNRIYTIYNDLTFSEKYTDLYNFLQTDELADNESLKWFIDKITKTLNSLFEIPVTDSWINLFASYYRAGNYLLCHDDMVEGRMLAFCYYLEDYESGDLILYDNNCMSEYKRLKVKSNQLVIFEVSPISFHEVGFCEKDGRKAFTGWLYVKGRNEIEPKLIELDCKIPSGIISPQISLADGEENIDLDENDIIFIPSIEYEFEIKSRSVDGPFINRKVELLCLNDPIIPSFKGLELIHGEFMNFRIGDYILLNDKINNYGGNEELYDCFIFNAKYDDYSPINYVNENGINEFSISIQDDGIFLIARKNRSIFVERVTIPFMVAHFIYLKKNN